ncbi:hypothetical protein [Archangium sp.]|uniref:hypothetical protein n=1 Tax=Archangium sp. TaxID=1872627 RepID=UPI002D38654E|nr:hypothetical protein [Archangium sp.]HYO60023.1 hypothetical protein [Archangium sp.]
MALLVLAGCALLAGCATDPHWRMEHARAHPPGAWRLSSSASAEPASAATPWWEDYRPLIPREQDTCALLQKSAQVDEHLRLVTNHPLHPQQALALWSWLARAPLSLRTFAPRTALAWLLRHALAQGRQLSASELRPLCERFLALVVMRPDGYLASASSGQPSQRMGEVALREGTLAAGNFVVGRLYLSRGGVFYPLDEELRLSSGIPLGELGLEKDLVNTALDGAEAAFAETALALAASLMDVDGTLEGLGRLPTTVATLIESSPEYFARYRDRPLREQVREAARLSTHLLMLAGGAGGTGVRMAGAGVRLPVLRLDARGLLAVEEVAVPVGTVSAALGSGAGALVLMSAPPPFDSKAARVLYDKGMQEARKAFPHLAGGPRQEHHIHPRYLGGPDNGPTVNLDPAYHQLITNEFRKHHGYGLGAPNLKRALELMRLVYSKYPLPGVHF